VTLQDIVVSIHNLVHKELGISKVCRQWVVTSVYAQNETEVPSDFQEFIGLL
jgi:hypothetical protein